MTLEIKLVQKQIWGLIEMLRLCTKLGKLGTVAADLTQDTSRRFYWL